MGKGGTRRSRCDENARKPDEIMAASVKRTRSGSMEAVDKPAVERSTAEATAGQKEQGRKGRNRRRSRGKKNRESKEMPDREGTAMATALHPINVNAVLFVPEAEKGLKKVKSTDQTKKTTTSEPEQMDYQPCPELSGSTNTVSFAANCETAEGNARQRHHISLEVISSAEFSSPSSAHSPESPKAVGRTVIWSNAAFCSEVTSQQVAQTFSLMTVDNPTSKLVGDTAAKEGSKQKFDSTATGSSQGAVPVASNDWSMSVQNKFKDSKTRSAEGACSTPKENDMVFVGEQNASVSLSKSKSSLEEGRGNGVQFVKEDRIQVLPSEEQDAVKEDKMCESKPSVPIVEDEEAEHLEKEIEKEIELLSKRLTELRARREARHISQDRAKRALSCPPTPISKDKEQGEETPNDADKNKCRKGRMVSAKFLQWQTKSPADIEPKTGEKGVQIRKFEASGTPFQRRGLLVAGSDQKENSLQKSSKKPETTPRIPRSKVIEKPQGGPVVRGQPQPGNLKKTESRGSLDGNLIEQMRDLNLSPACNWSDCSKRFDWTKTLRSESGKAVERFEQKKLSCDGGVEFPADENQKRSSEDADNKSRGVAVKGCVESQLLVNLKENKALKVSPAVTRKVRNVASRYTESPVQSASRKRSLDGPSQTSDSGSVTTTHRKRASLDQQVELNSPVSRVSLRKSCIGGLKSGLQTSGSASQPKCDWVAEGLHSRTAVVNKEGIDSKRGAFQATALTPLKASRKDGLETEKKKLPKIIINRDMGHSPRDSGCIKRATQAEKKSHFFSTEHWDAGNQKK